MSVGGISGGKWHKLSLTQTVKSEDGALKVYKIGALTLSPELGAELAGSNIEFEFVQVDTASENPETLSLAKVLIGLSK